MKNRVIIVVGLTCAGKGYLFQSLIMIGMKIVELDMGDILRHLKRRDPDFAAKISAAQNSGSFCSGDIVNCLADEKLEDFSKRPAIYLSGYPRTSQQLEHFLENPIIQTHDVTVVHIDTPKEICFNRASASQRGRDDDHCDAVKKKFNDYYQETFPVIKILKEVFSSFTLNGKETDKELMNLIDVLGLYDLIDVNQISDEVKGKFNLWDLVDISADFDPADSDFIGSGHSSWFKHTILKRPLKRAGVFLIVYFHLKISKMIIIYLIPTQWANHGVKVV